ncbi:MAG: ABC transporter permease [Candidatus Auribacterota bacterium]|uniref:ABC-2 type transporter transmembrane domain-containing protein n=1 Tax=Candidatus Auribacter fodinae TaxID=2093366 RepID=A0A3A4R9V6_9BACT|nr:MAG: hypothetical protein C4541_00590 [Candidatus Auribacter fodinae]
MSVVNSSNREPEVIYSIRGAQFRGIRGRLLTTRLMARELISSRELIFRLYARDFSTKYRQSALGVLWALLVPLATVAIFAGMNSAGVFTIEEMSVPYVVYALLGISIFNLFNGVLIASTPSVVFAQNMVSKINFPKTALVFSASIHGLVDFAVRGVLLCGVFLLLKQSPHPAGSVLGVVALLPLYLFSVGVAFFSTMLNAILRDITNVVNFGCMGIMMLSPVLYPISGDSLVARFNVWNPFNYFINVPRDLILFGSSKQMVGYGIWSMISLAVFYVGWRFFFIAQNRIVERI